MTSYHFYIIFICLGATLSTSTLVTIHFFLVKRNFLSLNCKFQACRGEDTDKGACHEVATDWDGSSMPQRKRRMHGTDTHTNSYANFGEVNKARPTWEDMIIAYSTIPGFASIREHDKGTW